MNDIFNLICVCVCVSLSLSLSLPLSLSLTHTHARALHIHSIIPSPSFPDFSLVQSMKNTFSPAILTMHAGQSSDNSTLLPHHTVPHPKRRNFHTHHPYNLEFYCKVHFATSGWTKTLISLNCINTGSKGAHQATSGFKNVGHYLEL